jgi:transcriptional regulator with XRE-family HTH domain
MRARREELGWSQEKVGVLIGLDESSSRARISRYELGVHEPPIAIARLIADALRVPLPYLYCDDDDVAALLLAMFDLPRVARRDKARALLRALSRAR